MTEISDLRVALSIRTENVLRNKGITTLEQLTDVSAAELLMRKNFGKVSLAEVRRVLADHGLKLKGDR